MALRLFSTEFSLHLLTSGISNVSISHIFKYVPEDICMFREGGEAPLLSRARGKIAAWISQSKSKMTFRSSLLR